MKNLERAVLGTAFAATVLAACDDSTIGRVTVSDATPPADVGVVLDASDDAFVADASRADTDQDVPDVDLPICQTMEERLGVFLQQAEILAAATVVDPDSQLARDIVAAGLTPTARFAVNVSKIGITAVDDTENQVLVSTCYIREAQSDQDLGVLNQVCTSIQVDLSDLGKRQATTETRFATFSSSGEFAQLVTVSSDFAETGVDHYCLTGQAYCFINSESENCQANTELYQVGSFCGGGTFAAGAEESKEGPCQVSDEVISAVEAIYLTGQSVLGSGSE